MAHISHDGSTIKIDGLSVEDPTLAGLLASHREDEWEGLVTRALAVGARGLLTMGLGFDLEEVQVRVRSALGEVLAEARSRQQELLIETRTAFDEQLSPDYRGSLTSRVVSELEAMLAQIDARHPGSHAGRLLKELEQRLGPGGDFQRQMQELLDPTQTGSPLAKLGRTIEARIGEVRDLIAGNQAKVAEAAKGTAKGFVYEDELEARLRGFAGTQTGWMVERCSKTPGQLGPDSLVGDLVVTIPGGHRIVVEAKHKNRLTLTGHDGVLAELEQAMANRSAGAAICVSAQDAFPREVGPLGIYDNRILCADDSDGLLLAVALRLAANKLTSTQSSPTPQADPAEIRRHAERILEVVDRFKQVQRALGQTSAGIEEVRKTLREMREQIRAQVEELMAAL